MKASTRESARPPYVPGHTPFLDVWADALGLEELKVVSYVARHSWGEDRDEAAFHVEDAARGTGLAPALVEDALLSLDAAGVMVVSPVLLGELIVCRLDPAWQPEGLRP